MENNKLDLNGCWDAASFFAGLTMRNRLAKRKGFLFCSVSGLEGFEQALENMKQSTAFVCVSDVPEGSIELNNSPHTRQIKTVFFAMRHAMNDMEARKRCMTTLKELFRQFASVLIREKVKLEQNCIYLDPRISFTEIDKYFFSGCACAYYQIAVDVYTDLRFNADEWDDE